MESSIGEFLMRQLAFEQLPTLRACEHDAYRASGPRASLSPSPALRSGARPTRPAEFAGDCLGGNRQCTKRAVAVASTRAPKPHTFSAFWL